MPKKLERRKFSYSIFAVAIYAWSKSAGVCDWIFPAKMPKPRPLLREW
jgi:hypothetical protein